VPKDYAESSENRRKKKSGKKSKSDKYSGKKSKKKSRPQTSSRDKKPMPWKAILLLIIIVVLIILGLALLSHHSHIKKQSQGAAVVTAQPVNISSAKAQAPIQPAEVVFNTASSAQSSKNSRYMLQLGSYQKTDENFEVLKNKLQKNNVHAKMIKTIHNDQTFYRVQLGPYKTQAAAGAMQQQLQQENINSVQREIN